ncbi:MAG: D-aminoacylase, partial [Gemmatimonadetes bacterium]|nr:D-aminoacylase [Gemmatimonadota bacterium]
DIVIFDAEQIGEQADFDQPYRFPRGIDHVFINGVAALRDGQLQDSRSGRILRHAA